MATLIAYSNCAGYAFPASCLRLNLCQDGRDHRADGPIEEATTSKPAGPGRMKAQGATFLKEIVSEGGRAASHCLQASGLTLEALLKPFWPVILRKKQFRVVARHEVMH